MAPACVCLAYRLCDSIVQEIDVSLLALFSSSSSTTEGGDASASVELRSGNVIVTPKWFRSSPLAAAASAQTNGTGRRPSLTMGHFGLWSWDFNCFEFSTEELGGKVIAIFHELKLHRSFQIPELYVVNDSEGGSSERRCCRGKCSGCGGCGRLWVLCLGVSPQI